MAEKQADDAEDTKAKGEMVVETGPAIDSPVADDQRALQNVDKPQVIRSRVVPSPNPGGVVNISQEEIEAQARANDEKAGA